jgi:RNA polymerase sigma factor (sigma-70 family)
VALPPFQTFLEEHVEAIHRFLMAAVGPQEAEDCLQDTLIAALRNYHRLRPDSNVRAWALTIAKNKVVDAARSGARRPLPTAHTDTVRASSNHQPLDPDLWRAVRDLPSKQREAITLRYATDLAHRDIAIAMGCSEAAARRSVHEGLKRLREVLA